MKKYDIILADPPWHFHTYAADEPGQTHNRSRGANRYYPTMRQSDIINLCPPTKDNAALFLWTTWPHMPDAIRLIAAWGFEYKTIAWVWVKANRSGFGHFMGMGYYTRANTESCLLAVRGKMPVAAHDVLALIYSPVRGHSRKPDEQYTKITQLYPFEQYPNRLEMFARRRRDPTWDVFGNEVEDSILITDGLSPFEEHLLTVVSQKHRNSGGPVKTSDIVQDLAKPHTTLLYWLRKLEARNAIYRKTQRGGWLPNPTFRAAALRRAA